MGVRAWRVWRALMVVIGTSAMTASRSGDRTRDSAAAPLPLSSLAVRATGGDWIDLWRSDHAPERWRAPSEALLGALRWRAASSGVSWGEVVLAGRGEAWRTRLVVLSVDPSRVRLGLDTAFTSRGAAWTIDELPAGATFAVNAGQFLTSMPWGWVVLDGRQFLSPANGPLSTALVADSSGHVRFVHAPSARASATGLAWAFQSYPTLLRDGSIPAELRRDLGAIDVGHRDARAAIGQSRDGGLVIALTRFDAVGESLGWIPFGLTTPEMAAIMGALGAVDAVMLDGGISAQLVVRDSGGALHRWPGTRSVPLALVGY